MDELIEAYEYLAELTGPLCETCPRATSTYRCCKAGACEIARMIAREHWGTELQATNHTSGIPYMSDTGCTVAPHLRPHCTGHVCIEALEAAPPEVQEEYHSVRAFIHRLETSLRG